MIDIMTIGLDDKGNVVPLEEANKVIVTEWEDDRLVKETIYIRDTPADKAALAITDNNKEE